MSCCLQRFCRGWSYTLHSYIFSDMLHGPRVKDQAQEISGTAQRQKQGCVMLFSCILCPERWSCHPALRNPQPSSRLINAYECNPFVLSRFFFATTAMPNPKRKQSVIYSSLHDGWTLALPSSRGGRSEAQQNAPRQRL